MPRLASLTRGELLSMRAAGLDVLEFQRVLAKGGLNIVGELLRGADGFVEYDHYPEDDVFDADSGAQYYYHAHRGLHGEHGHFHTFLRARGMPAGVSLSDMPHAEPWPEGNDALCHLISISMDAYGAPIGLFAPNRWVTGDTWYPADEVVRMLDCFRIDHANPSWPVNRWLGAMFLLYRPHIIELLHARDRKIALWREKHPREDVLEDRELEILAHLPISIAATMSELDMALAVATR
ncbi:MAG: hypothetical protein JSS40_05090 [Proteobacteria bacterium]|nr:hypothetical protein [Pseudomonadota bacterium]